jgi:hypothetical protein
VRHGLEDDGWNAIIEVMADKKITRLHPTGQMTDAGIERLVELDHLTYLNVSNSTRFTDAGLWPARPPSTAAASRRRQYRGHGSGTRNDARIAVQKSSARIIRRSCHLTRIGGTLQVLLVRRRRIS